MNITEDYCSFEVAKLLKEKGFNWENSPFYSKQDKDEWVQNNNYNIPNPNYDANIPFDSEILNVITPHVSLQTALKWLREVHNIFIIIDYVVINKSFYQYTYEIHNMRKGRSMALSAFRDDYETYEKAVEAAIKYCLTNLIK